MNNSTETLVQTGEISGEISPDVGETGLNCEHPPELSKDQLAAINDLESQFADKSEWRRLCLWIPQSVGDDEVQMISVLMHVSTNSDKTGTRNGIQYRRWDDVSKRWLWSWTEVRQRAKYDNYRHESLILTDITPKHDDGTTGSAFTLTMTSQGTFIEAGDPTYPPRIFATIPVSSNDCSGIVNIKQAPSDSERRLQYERDRKWPTKAEQQYRDAQRAKGKIARCAMDYRDELASHTGHSRRRGGVALRSANRL